MTSSRKTRISLRLALLFFLVLTAGGGSCGVNRLSAGEADENHPGRTFWLTFDGKSTSADQSLGNPNALTFKDNLEFRTVPGYNKNNAFRIKEGELLHYDITKNIDHRQGTYITWLMAENYDPSSVSQSDPNPSHKSYAYIRFANGKQYIDIFLYQYYTAPSAYLYWNSSFNKKKMYALAGAPLTSIKKGQWFQLAATWDAEEIRLYLNGEFQSKAKLPEGVKQALAMIPNAKESFIGVRSRLWPVAAADLGKDTLVDDIAIYNRALSSLEIKKQFVQAGGDKLGDDNKFANIDIQLNGVDDLLTPLDRLRVDLDYNALPVAWQKELLAGELKGFYQLSTPSIKNPRQRWIPSALKETKIIRGAGVPGNYVFSIILTNANGETQTATKKIVRPKTAWLNNNLGREDKVPTPWTPLEVHAGNRVTVWKRSYVFGNSPLPLKVIHGGDSLLTKPPTLLIETAAGLADIKWTVTSRRERNTAVTFYGIGTADTFSITWQTRVEFDGMIRWDFVIHGAPKVKSMRLVWTVDRKFSEFVMDPLLQQTGNGTYRSFFPFDARKSATTLWLTSREKGFCWSPEHDANWVYDPKTEKPIQAVVDDTGGHCQVTMISHPVTIPEGAAYHAMFLATPSRPLPKNARSYRLGSYGRQPLSDFNIVQNRGAGTDGVFSLRPVGNFAAVMEYFRSRKMKALFIYGGATALNNYCQEGKYFGKYWEIPGGPIVPFNDTIGNIECLQTNTCPRTHYSDYILNSIKELFDNPAQMHVGIYYDLANNYVCRNALHGCQFKDRFGRTISRLIIMGLRAHLMRTLKYCHARGRYTMFHAHSFYNPMIHAFGDYWYPGEQYCSQIQREKSPYVYSDSIPEAVFQSELNMHIKGSGILFLGNLRRANKKYGTAEQTMAMCTKLLLHDVPITIAFEDGAVINKIWGVRKRFDLDRAKIIYHYEKKKNQIKSDNPGIVVTYYTCPDKRVLAVVGNITKKAQTATLDLSALLKKGQSVRDEMAEKEIPVTNGAVSVAIPARLFKLLGF